MGARFRPAMFVVVGNDIIITSEDGITWTEQTAGYGGQTLQCVYFSEDKGMYVAGGWQSIYVSVDGINWVLQHSSGGEYIFDVIWSPNSKLFIAVGGAGGGGPRIRTSPNGITWTPRTVPDETGSILGVVEGSDKIVATGKNYILYSEDGGITWQSQAAPVTDLQGISWNGSYYMVIGNNVAGGFAYIGKSTDGLSWTRKISGSAGNIYNGRNIVSSGGNLWVAVGMKNTIISQAAYSANGGELWIPSYDNYRSSEMKSVFWNGETFIAVGFRDGSGGQIILSELGYGWTESDGPGGASDHDYYGVTWGGEGSPMFPYTLHHIDKNLRG